MQVLENKIPPPIVTLLFALAMWVIARLTPTLTLTKSTSLPLALAFALVGAIVCAAGVISFRRARTTVNPLKPNTASALVDSGIYRFTRNPMYLGFALFLVAWAIFLHSPWAILGVAALVLFLNRFQIIPEERALAELFGAEFANYRASVRRWI